MLFNQIFYQTMLEDKIPLYYRLFVHHIISHYVVAWSSFFIKVDCDCLDHNYSYAQGLCFSLAFPGIGCER